MCIIAYKPTGVDFPNKRTLKACFENNSDGAGFMYADGETVRISKGYMSFRKFWKALRSAREITGDDVPYVMHFRITTQGGTREDCTHPFPLSDKMDDLRKLRTTADIGVAHNGIISLTSSYNKNITYSDTMEYITDYLSLMIDSLTYYNNKNILKLIERTVGSRLAILDKTGHCELIGTGWINDGDMWYSNSSYCAPSYSKGSSWGSCYYGMPEYEGVSHANDYLYTSALEDYYDTFFNTKSCEYEFNEYECPFAIEGDDAYCDMCSNYKLCWMHGNGGELYV